MRLYAASIVAALRSTGDLTVGTKFILAQNDEEAKEIADASCFEDFPVRRGYTGHIAVVQPIRDDSAYRGSDGRMYCINVEPV